MNDAESLAGKIMTGLEELPYADEAQVADLVRQHTPDDPAEPGEPFRGWIDAVDVQGVRAFGDNQRVDLGRGLTIIYAENGAGKTSFIDAIELLRAGKTSRARQFPEIASEVKDKDHIRHAADDGTPVQLPPRVVARWHQTPGEDLRCSVWESTWDDPAIDAPPSHLLARRRLREVLAAKGADRAEHLGKSLGLGAVMSAWGGARRILDNKARDQDAEEVPEAIAESVRSCVQNDLGASAIAPAELQAVLEDRAQAEIDRLRAQEHESCETGRAAEQASLLAGAVPAPPAPPSPYLLLSLAGELEEHGAARAESRPIGVDAPVLRMLAAFRVVAEPGARCAACTDGHVSAERLAAIEALLEAAKLETEYDARSDALPERAVEAVQRCSVSGLRWELPERRIVAPDSDAATALERFQAGYDRLRSRTGEWSLRIGKVDHCLAEARANPIAVTVRDAAQVLSSLVDLHAELEDTAGKVENLRIAARSSHMLTQPRNPELDKVERAKANTALVAEAAIELQSRREKSNAYKIASRELKKRLDTVVSGKCHQLAEPINAWLTRLAPGHTPQVLVDTRGTSGRPALDIVVAGGNTKAIGRLSDSQLDMLGLAAHLATLEREAPGEPVFIDDPTDMLDHPTREQFAGDGLARLLDGEVEGSSGRQVTVLTHDEQLVQALWRHHGHRWPCTMQILLELDRDTNPPHTVVTPRSADQYLDRVKKLLDAHPNSGNRLWLRSAAGNQTRQALELIIKDLLTIVGPRGLRSRETPIDAGTGAGSAYGKLRPIIEEIDNRQRKCGSRRHVNAQRRIADLLDCVERRKEYFLDEASHADFVYPNVTQIRHYVGTLRQLAQLLQPRDGGPADEWPMNSHWSEILAGCQDCPSLEK